jgi:hypothetical protein
MLVVLHLFKSEICWLSYILSPKNARFEIRDAPWDYVLFKSNFNEYWDFLPGTKVGAGAPLMSVFCTMVISF